MHRGQLVQGLNIAELVVTPRTIHGTLQVASRIEGMGFSLIQGDLIQLLCLVGTEPNVSDVLPLTPRQPAKGVIVTLLEALGVLDEVRPLFVRDHLPLVRGSFVGRRLPRFVGLVPVRLRHETGPLCVIEDMQLYSPMCECFRRVHLANCKVVTAK